MYALDFFCGAGGLTRGFLNAGIEVVAGIDIDEDCLQTYEENNAPAKFIPSDLRNLKHEEIANLIRGIPRDQLVFAGCAPCQPFSKQRRVVGHKKDRTLLSHFAELVRKFKPAFVVIENVPGIAKVPGNSTYRRFTKILSSLDYRFAEGRLDAKWFGVPQTRRRWVVIAALE